MGEEASKRISEGAAAGIRAAVKEASGNEVFFIGEISDGLVRSTTVAARGNDYSVPALTHMARPGSVVIHNHPGEDLTPSDADLSIASALAEENIAFYITNNAGEKIYAVTEPFAEREYAHLKDGELSVLFGPDGAGGAVSKALEGYETREEQVRMAAAVANAFNMDKILTVEAGTGVGKSLAYLVPSILWATRNRERVVVATKTINLQEQLIKKDIPLLEEALATPFKAVLVKGRSNYVCLRKVHEAEREPSLFDEEDETLAVIKWTKRTRDGSLSDLSFTPKQGVWERLASESDTCLRLKCAHYDDCFFNISRREVPSADLLVVNHHLLFSDAAIKEAKGSFTEAAVLPPFNRLVIDEAHGMEESATAHFGAHITGAGISKQLGRLRSKHEARKGLLPFLASKAQKLPLPLGAVVDKINKRLLELTEDCHASTSDTFSTLFHFFHARAKSDDSLVKFRIDREVKEDEDFGDLSGEVKKYTSKLRTLSEELRSLLKEVSEVVRGERDAEEKLLPTVIEIRAMASRISDMAGAMADILFIESEDAVRWVEIQAPPMDNPRRPARVAIKLSPLKVAPRIKETLLDNVDTAVMTSATLSVKRSFKFFEERSGVGLVPEERRATLLLDSPFDYVKNVELILAPDLPEPTDSSFGKLLAKKLPEIVKEGGGACLALFTSYGLLRWAFDGSKKRIEELGYNVMRQGEGPRHSLLERFKEDETSVLFGTDSFWEGVDVPGDALKTVVITRLPFEVPNDPVAEARQEEIERSGGNPFREYLLPNAVIRFRQGFGRLVRRKTDSGRVVILDSRIVKKPYGGSFLRSIPECKVVGGGEKAAKATAAKSPLLTGSCRHRPPD